MFRVLVDNEKYKSGELVFYRVGYEHKEETKHKIRESRVGLLMITDGSEMRYITESTELPEGWRFGAPERYSQLCKERFLGTKHYTNTETGERCRATQCPPGFVEGRTSGFETGLELMNSKTKVYDISERCRKLIDGSPNRFQTRSPNNSISVQIGNFLFDSRELFLECFPFINPNRETVSTNVGRSTKEGRAFKKKYGLKKLCDIGISVCRIDKWDGDPNEVLFITKETLHEFKSRIDEYRRTLVSS